MTGLFLDVCGSMALPSSIVSGFLTGLVPLSFWQPFLDSGLLEGTLGLVSGLLVGLVLTLSGFLAHLLPVSSWPFSGTGGFLKGLPGEKCFFQPGLHEATLGLVLGVLAGLFLTLSGFLAGLVPVSPRT